MTQCLSSVLCGFRSSDRSRPRLQRRDTRLGGRVKLDVRHWQEIDAEYLTGVLAHNEIKAQIANVTKTPVGTGQIGDCIRFELEYRSNAPGAPDSIVGKFPAEAADSRTAGVEFGIYEREVKFYQQLQPKARISTPDCYLAQFDDETHDFVLLMSDEAPAVQGDQIAGISLEQTKTVIREAAKLHSAFWMDTAVFELDWMPLKPQVEAVFGRESMLQVWAAFCERYGDLLTPKAETLGTAMVNRFDDFRAMQAEHLCLVHVDFRPDNMLFASEKGGKALSVVDWQSIIPGPAATDIGYCVAGALDPGLRREHEQELLDLYSRSLEELGAGPYEPEAVKRHYVLGAYQLFRTAFHSSMFVERTERGDRMFMKMLNGAVDLIHDHDAQGWFA